jgi:predicted phage terminase large subunit-like protein
VETIQAQFEAYRQLNQNLTKRGYYKTRIRAVNPKTKKELRIESLEPLVEQGILRFKRNQHLLLEMMLQYPNHNHDDGVDCLAGAVDLIGLTRKRTYHKKPKGY